MPNSFKDEYPSTRCIIDATEIFIEQPSSPVAQQLTFSNYKNHNTFKVLVGITPSGAISFISNLMNEQLSEVEMVETRRIASLRIHVERAIGRIKTFQILSAPVPNSMAGIMDRVFFVCGMLTNFKNKLTNVCSQ